MPVGHREIDRVTTSNNSIPVNLLLQTRTNSDGSETFYNLSWRTRYASGRSNRRFYYTNADGYWRIPVSVALRLLELAERKGLLDEIYDDPQVRHSGSDNNTIDSRQFGTNVQEVRRAFAEIADESEDWGQHPIFIVVEVPDGTWRKIMVVDSKREFCTFRSTTTDGLYGQLTYRPRLTSPWVMDNAMQDASAAMMRQFLEVLREI